MRILYIRHGKSIANANGTIGEPDTPLAEEGLEQARTTGQHLKQENVSTIVCSPFIRAQQTAEIIAGELGIPIADITILDELHERRMGELEGGPKQQPTEFYYQNDTDFGFESQQQLITRLKLALDTVKEIAEKASGTVIVVGHATSGFYFLQVAKGKTNFAEFEPVSQMENAEFIEVNLA